MPFGMPCSLVSSAQAFSQIPQVASVHNLSFPVRQGPTLSSFPDCLLFLRYVKLNLRYFVPILRKFASGRLRNQCCQSGRQTESLGWGSGYQMCLHRDDGWRRVLLLPASDQPASPPITIGKSFHALDHTPSEGVSYAEDWGIHPCQLGKLERGIPA